MKRLVLVVIVLLVAAATLLLCRCSCGGKKPVCGTDKDATKVAHQLKFKRTASGELQSYVDGGCTPPCPSNSPIVNSFPINGLDPAGIGTCNPEHVRIDPGNAGKPVKCPNGSVQYSATTGTLVIKHPAGATCAGTDLIGASFTARTDSGNVKLTIKDVITIPVGSATKEAYRIVASIPGSTPSAADLSVCDSTRAGQTRAEMGLPPNIGTYSATSPTWTPPPPPPHRDFVIALPGPLYTNTVQTIASSDGFFNLACVGNSLAKLTVEGVTLPTDGTTTQYAALRMMTDTFCNVPRTTAGMNLHYSRGLGSGSGVLEAEWTAAGATCLEDPRLSQEGDYPSVVFSADLIPPGCGSAGHQFCATFSDFASKVREECATGSDAITVTDHCTGSAGVRFTSYVP